MSRKEFGGRALTLLVLMLTAFFSVAPLLQAQQPVTIKLWDYHVHDKKFRQNIFKQFNKDHPDIKVEYTSQVGDTYQTVLDASFRSDTPPDIWVPAGAITLLKAIEMGWVMPLDDVAPSGVELAKWMARFPQEQQPFLEGSNIIKGKVYSWPIGGQVAYNILFYNTKLFRDAGIKDAAGEPTPPVTLAEMRASARKITELGQGKVYGVVHGIKTLSMWYWDLIYPSMGDGSYDPYNFRTGRFDYTSGGLQKWIQFWMDMKKDGSVFPGDLSMDDEQAKYKFAQNLAGMRFGGPWEPGGFLAVNDSLEFDVAANPTETQGVRKGYTYIGALAAVEYVVSRKTKSRDAVWKVIQFITSQAYQEGWVKAAGGFSVFPEYNKPEYFAHPTLFKIVQMGMTDRKTIPPFPGDAWPLMEYSQPNLLETIQGIYVGILGWPALGDLERRNNESFDKAIAEAQKRGSKVTRADYTFPDWDPTKNYTKK